VGAKIRRVFSDCTRLHCTIITTYLNHAHALCPLLPPAAWCCCCCCCVGTAVNNVGTNIRKPSTGFSPDDYSTIFTTNLESAFSLSQLFHPLLQAAGSSVLLFNSSVAGGVVCWFLYCIKVTQN
jgi:NAD(P)-dependent dehydrogenase (short-subunit alcohol dehydrogenase family)